MCFYFKQSKSAQEVQHRFKATFEQVEAYQPGIYNGFQYPATPIITNVEPHKIKLFHWGLIPFWAKDDRIRQYTLNARIETIHEKPSFSSVVHNRCLILADGFYEWQWLDEKGKKKQKYELTLPDGELFAFAGLWSAWLDKSTGELRNTYALLTTEANVLLSKIHNSNKRMPVILSADAEQNWLHGHEMMMQNDALLGNKA